MTGDQFIWQERGTSWKGVAIYHVTASAVVRNQRKAAFGVLTWNIADDRVTDAYVEWSELGHRLWDCMQQIPKRYPEIRICAATIMPDHMHMILYVTKRMETTFNVVLRGWVQGCKKAAKACGLVEQVFAEKPFIRVMTYKGQLQTMTEYVKLNPYRMAVRLAYSGYFAIQRGIHIAGQNYAAVGNLNLLYEPHKWQVHVHKELVWDAEKGNNQPLRNYKNECVIGYRPIFAARATSALNSGLN